VIFDLYVSEYTYKFVLWFYGFMVLFNVCQL
jgi:hypothetical protein